MSKKIGRTIHPSVLTEMDSAVKSHLKRGNLNLLVNKLIKSILSKKAAVSHELKSSNIKAVGYDKKEQELEVHFHSGGEYKYKDVPKSLFDRIRRVKSPGKFLNKHIKKDNKYVYEKLKKEAMTLSATKALLRKFRAGGGKVIREPGGGAYEYYNKVITLPTRREKDNPLTTLWHEYGHAIDPDIIQPPTPKTRSNAEVLADLVHNLPLENRANTNALNEMKRLGVPLNLQKKYIDAVTPGFNTYKSESYISGPGRKHLDSIGVPFSENFIEGSHLYSQAIERESKNMLPVGNAIANMRLPELREGLELKDPFKELHRSATKNLRKTNPAYDKAFRQFHSQFKHELSLPVAGVKQGELEKAAGATPERIRELIVRAAQGCKESKDALSAMSKSRAGKPRSARVKPNTPILPSVIEKMPDAQGMFPFAGSHEFEILRKTLDPSHVIDKSKYLGKQI